MNNYLEGYFSDFSCATFGNLSISQQINNFQKDKNCEFISILSSYFDKQSDCTRTRVLFKSLDKEL